MCALWSTSGSANKMDADIAKMKKISFILFAIIFFVMQLGHCLFEPGNKQLRPKKRPLNKSYIANPIHITPPVNSKNDVEDYDIQESILKEILTNSLTTDLIKEVGNKTIIRKKHNAPWSSSNNNSSTSPTSTFATIKYTLKASNVTYVKTWMDLILDRAYELYGISHNTARPACSTRKLPIDNSVLSNVMKDKESYSPYDFMRKRTLYLPEADNDEDYESDEYKESNQREEYTPSEKFDVPKLIRRPGMKVPSFFSTSSSRRRRSVGEMNKRDDHSVSNQSELEAEFIYFSILLVSSIFLCGTAIVLICIAKSYAQGVKENLNEYDPVPNEPSQSQSHVNTCTCSA